MVTLILILTIKLAAYIWWSYAGFTPLKLHFAQPVLRAIVYGLVRLLIGLAFGMILFYLALLMFDSSKPLLSETMTYLIAYMPIRWLEWGILELIMNPKSRTFDYLIFGVDSDARGWRIGGLVICAVLDVPFIFMTKGVGLGNFYLC